MQQIFHPYRINLGNIITAVILILAFLFSTQLQSSTPFFIVQGEKSELTSNIEANFGNNGRLTITADATDPVTVLATNNQIHINNQIVNLNDQIQTISINANSPIEIGKLDFAEGIHFTVQTDGSITVNDTIKAPAGSVRLESAGDISVLASIDVNGRSQAGTIIIGSNPKESTPSQYLAQNIFINQNVHLSADAIERGDGGDIIIWAEKDTQMLGSVSVRGGAVEGDGGFVEVSGKETWTFPNWSKSIDITAPNGAAGHFLLDPNDISIINSSGSPIGSSPANANTLTDADIANFLQSTGSLTIETTGTGGNGDVTINGDVNITWTSGSNLTINADRSIVMNNGMVIRTTSGNVTFNANSSGTTSGAFTAIMQRGTVETIGTGDIYFSGIGGDDGTSGQNSGVQIWGTVRSTATGASAGTITLDGTAVAGTNINYPVSVRGSITSVDGDIQITGQGNASVTGFLNHGVHIQSSQVTSTGTSNTAASITINGTAGGGSSNNNGVRVEGSTARVSAVAGDINITGQGGAGGLSVGLIVMQGGQIQSTGTGASAGNITANVTGGSSSQGLRIEDTDSGISSVDGDITISGTAGGSTQGIRILDSANGIESTGASNISLTGTSSNIDIRIDVGTIGGPSHSGNISLFGNVFDLTGGTIQSSGALLIEPRTAGTTIGLGGGSGTLNLNDTELGFFADGFSNITIGKSNAGNITADSATFNDPLTLITANNISNSSSGGTDLTAPSITFNGTVAPSGTFGVNGNTSFANNSGLQLDLTGTPSGGTHDQLNVAGSVTLGSSVGLTLSTSSYSAASGEITAVSNDASDPISGTFNGLPEGANTNPGTNPNFTVSYGGGSGNDITLTDLNTADLSLTIGDSPDPVDPTQNLTYSFNVVNGGPNPAYNVVSNITLPAGVTFVSSSGCAEDPNGTPTCSLGTIAASGSSSFQIVVSVDASTSGDITLNGSVSSDATDTSLGNNSDSETTTVGTPPVLASVTPVDNATGVALNANLIADFNETIQAGSGNITIHLTADDSIVHTLPVGGSDVSISGSQLTINPPTDFDYITGYYVNIPATAIEDVFGTSFAGITNNTAWNFTTIPDTTSPTLSSLNPVDNAVDVAVATNLVLTLNEDVQKGSGNITIHLSSDNSVVQTIDVTGAAVTISGNEVTINPPADLGSETEYYVNIPAGAIEDLAGNDFAGITDSTTWSFTSADVIPPAISTLSPTDNAIAVAIDTNLIITFVENIQAGSGNVTIHLASDDSVVHTLPVTGSDVSVSGNQLIINPPTNFGSEIQYYVNIDTGTVQDLSSNNFTGISDKTTWNFTSADVIAPTITSLSPADNEIDVLIDSNLTITFTENIQADSGNITIHLASDDSVVHTLPVTGTAVSISGNAVTINPPTDFGSETQYYVNIEAGAIQDVSSNNFAGISDKTTWNFTSEDVIPPVISILNPLDDAIQVPIKNNLVIEFNETIQAGSGNITLHLASDDSVVHTLPVTGSDVSVSGNQLTINPPADFGSETAYYVNIESGTIQDLSGNNFAGINDKTTWNFTSIDVDLPYHISFSPADNATGVFANTQFTIQFSEAIQAGNGTITIHDTDDGSIVESFESTAVSIIGNTVTFTPTQPLDKAETYYINISNTAFQDLIGNEYPGITDTSSWNFKTENMLIYLPILTKPTLGPDLIVASLDVQANQVVVNIQNIGDEPVTGEFLG